MQIIVNNLTIFLKSNKIIDMKRLISLLLIFGIILGLTACGGSSSDPINHGSSIDEKFIGEDDPIYEQVNSMFAPVADFVEYNHILNNSINYEDVPSEDFWNIVAIVVSSYEDIGSYANIDAAGVYHLKWEDMLEFAKTFLYQSWYKNNTPSYRDSYSASADPGSGVIDLIPLSVDNFNASLASVARASAKADYDYVAYIDLATKEDKPTIYHYGVYLADWTRFLKEQYDEEDNAAHIMPFAVIGYGYIGKDESKD